MAEHCYTMGTTPEDLIKRLANEQCPGGYPMTIRSKTEWRIIADAWNQGIDSHLEALTERSSADHCTGEINVHPDELHVLLRRLFDCESDNDAEKAWSLRSGILSTLGVEEI